MLGKSKNTVDITYLPYRTISTGTSSTEYRAYRQATFWQYVV